MAAGLRAVWGLRALGLVCLWRCVVFTSCDDPQIYGAVNGSVTLRSPNSTSFNDNIWKKNKDKIIEWRKDDDDETVYQPFKDRVYLNRISGDLTIFDLTPSDEAEYAMEFSGRTMIRYALKVFEPLPYPTLNCTLTGENITVSCEIPQDYKSHQELITYSWHCSSAQCDSSSKHTIYFQKKDDLQQNILCTVSNPIINMTSSIVLRTCVPGDNSRSRYGLIALLVILIFIWPFMKCVLKCRRNPRGTDSS